MLKNTERQRLIFERRGWLGTRPLWRVFFCLVMTTIVVMVDALQLVDLVRIAYGTSHPEKTAQRRS